MTGAPGPATGSRFAGIRRIDAGDGSGLASELLHRLECRQRSVRRDTELREAPGLRQHLPLERTHRGVVSLDGVAEFLSHLAEVCAEVSEPAIELLTELADRGRV